MLGSNRLFRRTGLLACAVLIAGQACCADQAKLPAPSRSIDFDKEIRPIFAANCLGCHGPKKQKGEYRLDIKTVALKKGEDQPIVPGHGDNSPLIERVIGKNPEKIMPPDGNDPLTPVQIGLIRAWIDQGAVWPEKPGEIVAENRLDWWSLKPIRKPIPPTISGDHPKNPIDAFILAKLSEKKLTPSAPADRRSLLRRVYFDLIGLSPSPEEVDAFIVDASPDAYEKRVDALLASPRYGERWARHWIDAVHFAETHGHDQDRIRPNAWPYRDYLINSFNRDTPYGRFIQEQIAADVLFPEQPELTPALGFIAAGPWDESSLRDIREDSMCRTIGQYLDRDDMVMTTMSTFASSTVHCARCHDHKFDAISQQEYYGLQADFAGIGRAEMAYDSDISVRKHREELRRKLDAIARKDKHEVEGMLDPKTTSDAEAWIRQLRAKSVVWTTLTPDSVQSGQGAILTVLPDLSILASGPAPEKDTYTVVARTNMKNVTAVKLELIPDDSLPHKGPGRQTENGNLHLSEMKLKVAPSQNAGDEKPTDFDSAHSDFDQKNWTIRNAIDGKMDTAWGIDPEEGKAHWAVFRIKQPVKFEQGALLRIVLEQQHGRTHTIGRFRLSVTDSPDALGSPPEVERILAFNGVQTPEQELELKGYYLKQMYEKELAGLPPRKLVYAGARDFAPDGSHKPVERPRAVNILKRGDITKPIAPAQPGALACVADLKSSIEFPAAENAEEGGRRAALAHWLSDSRNVLVWRSIVNRVWHYHFGRGIVSSLNDFGHMGALPSHPELLDWLATDFLEHGASIKHLSRLIVTSATYGQSSKIDQAKALVDADNQFLWRMNCNRMDAESLHDAVLQFSGRLDLTMGGPSVQQFGLKPGPHVTPVVDYSQYDWNSAGAGRRSIYRFIFRTLPDPFMDALDCADASQLTAARNVSVTPLQALALMNDTFVLHHSELLAGKLAASGDLHAQILSLYRCVFCRTPTAHELQAVQNYAEKYGMANLCRMILNSNEFMFID